MIHKAISASQKLHYLNSFLQGDALGVIAGYRQTAKGYESALQQLLTRYDNSEQLFELRMKRMFEGERLTKATSAGIWKRIDTFDHLKREID